jgi:hypothetical protein
MKIYSFLTMKGFKGLTEEILIEAPDQDFAEIVFEEMFPKKTLIDVKEFHHNPKWMKPLDCLGVIPFKHRELDGIDFTGITVDDVINALQKHKPA